MITAKKGDFDPLKIIGGAVLVLLILVILIVILGKYFPGIINLRNCGLSGGRCVERGIGCAETEYQQQGFGGCSESQICCKPYEPTTGGEDIFTDKEREALVNAIILTLNKDLTPITERTQIDLKVGMNYTFHIKINDKLTKNAETMKKLGPCAVYVTDAKEKGKKYVLLKDGWDLTLPTSDTAIMFGEELDECVKLAEKKYNPSLLDAYKELTLYIILFDQEFGASFDNYYNFIGPLQPDVKDAALTNISEMYSNTQHWLAMRAYRLNVEPVVKFSGLSGAWVAKDDITLSCTDVTCTRFGLALVKLKDDSANGYGEMINECKQANFAYTLNYIAGTSLQTTGIPLNIDIGGFRLPSQQKMVYQTASKPITVVDNKAQITIDKATMISTFYNKTKNSELFIGDTTYLCVEATLKDSSKIYALSKTPLRVDVLPPYIDAEKGIKVIYPDPIQDIIPTSMGGTGSYFYREYPRVVITGCYDYGQSGCSNYDYYIHTGNFISLNSITADWETGVKALLLTAGLNALFNYFGSQDPLNTICPYMYGGYYRLNTRPEIRFPYEGQGIMCIRAADKVNNRELYWKELWTPEQMFKEIVSNASSEIIS